MTVLQPDTAASRGRSQPSRRGRPSASWPAPVDQDDLGDSLRVNGDAEVVRQLPYSAWQSMLDAEAWCGPMPALQAAGEGGSSSSRFATRGGRSAACCCSVTIRPMRGPRWPTCSAARIWGRGPMRDAVLAFCASAFAHAGRRRIEAEALAGQRRGLGRSPSGLAEGRSAPTARSVGPDGKHGSGRFEAGVLPKHQAGLVGALGRECAKAAKVGEASAMRRCRGPWRSASAPHRAPRASSPQGTRACASSSPAGSDYPGHPSRLPTPDPLGI